MKPMIQRLAETLAERGPMTTRQLCHVFGGHPEQIGDMMRNPHTRRRYGIEVIDRVADGSRGGPVNLWSVDTRVLQHYLEGRGEYTGSAAAPRTEPKRNRPHGKRSKSPKVPKVKLTLEMVTPKPVVYTGPILTRWQPSSPYFKGETNE